MGVYHKLNFVPICEQPATSKFWATLTVEVHRVEGLVEAYDNVGWEQGYI